MKLNLLMILVILLGIVNPLEAARGGGGRGGGGRAGGARAGGGGNFARTPSMSRAVPQQKVSKPTQTPVRQNVSKPTQTPVRQNVSRPTQTQVRQNVQRAGGQNVGQRNGAATRHEVQQILQQSPQRQQVRPTQQSQLSKSNLAQLQDKSRTTAGRVANQVRNNHADSGNWFNGDFNGRHNLSPAYPLAGAALWNAARWGDVSGWLGWGGTYPYYYNDSSDYGYYPSDYGTTGTSPQMVSTTNQAFQAQPIEPTTEDLQSSYGDQGIAAIQGDWMPLGVFAAGKNAQQAAYSNMIVQLAVSRSGEIAGTYYNAATDQAHPLDGVIVQQTQQAAWKMSDKSDSPLVTTGVYNLTQDVVPIQVHFTNNTIQDWTLVRLNQQ